MAKKQANPWVYALGGAVVGGLLLYWWRHRYPMAPVSFHPQLAVYRAGYGGSAITPLSLSESLPLEGPIPTPSAPAPAPPSPCGCKATQPQVVVDAWPVMSPLPQPPSAGPTPPPISNGPAPCPRLPGETLMGWQLRCGLVTGVITRG